jgi:hypothetical protein
MIVFAQRHMAHERNVVFQAAASADSHVWTDHAEGPDFDIRVDLGT